MNRWLVAATILGVCGLALATFSYFILGSIPLTALGIGALVTAASLAITPCEAPYREAALSILRAYKANISRVLEELAAQPGAVYTPDGVVAIPLRQAAGLPGRPEAERLLWKSPRGIFLILSSPAYAVEQGADLEAALELVLVDTLGLCDAVRASHREGTVLVELVGVKEAVEQTRFEQVLGPLPAHVAAAVAARVTGSPVRIDRWERRMGNLVVRLSEVSLGDQEG